MGRVGPGFEIVNPARTGSGWPKPQPNPTREPAGLTRKPERVANNAKIGDDVIKFKPYR
jgi:hypothetical protein